MASKIIWSLLAQENRKSILKYWIDRNKSNTYSVKLNHLFEEAVELISKFPTIGVKSNIEDVRIKIVRDYRIAYKINDDLISILTIWDSRQNPNDFDKIIYN